MGFLREMPSDIICRYACSGGFEEILYYIYTHNIYFKDPQRYFSHFCGKEIVHLRGKKAHTLHGTGMLSPHNWVISGQMMEYLPFSIWSICDGCFDDLDRLFNNKMEH